MHTIWVNPFTEAATSIECKSLMQARAIWDALNAAGFGLSARP